MRATTILKQLPVMFSKDELLQLAKDSGKKIYIREDTGETIEVLNMTAEEFQEEMNYKNDAIIGEARQLNSGYEIPDHKVIEGE